MTKPKSEQGKKPVTKKPTSKKSVMKDEPVSGEIIDQPATNLPAPIESAPEPTQSAIVKAEPKREAALSIVGGVTTEQLKNALTVQTEQRALIQEFIKDNLFVDIDYGKIHVVKNCQAEDRARGSCDKDYHYSKSILFKPGQEKIFSLFGIQDELEKDLEAYEMLGNMPGLVAYKCIMYRGENKVGEGRGAATLGGSQNDPNSTIKKAEKRARMDACLSLGFSAYFTQDLDDPEYKSQREMMNERARNEAERIDKDEFGLLPRNPEEPIDGQERPLLFKMILDYGIDKFYVIDSLKLNGIEKPETMTSGQARGLMGLIKQGVFKKPEQPEIPVDPVTVPDSQLPEDLYPDPPSVQEAALVIDDDLKEHVQSNFETIGFNARGKMWFMKHVAGKPFGAFEKFTDQEWRRAYQHIEDIMDLKVAVPDEYQESSAEPQSAVDKIFPGNQPLDIIEGPNGEKIKKSTGEIIEETPGDDDI